MIESGFVKVLVNNLKHNKFFVQRIESGTTGRGIPDIFVINPIGIPFWLECKCLHNNVRRVPWHGNQLKWLYNCYKKGVKTFTIVKRDVGEMFLIPHIAVFCCNKIDELPHRTFTNHKDLLQFLAGDLYETED